MPTQEDSGPPSFSAHPVSIGQQVAGRYLVKEHTGNGGMGVVYRAIEEEIEREVALKFITVDRALPAAEQDAYFERFRQEAQALGSLPPHPNRVVLYQYGQENHLHYMAMEFVRGESLDATITKGLTGQQLISYTRQMVRALVDVHASGIVHRDIKPENLIVTRSILGDEQLKLIDFGIARTPLNVQQEEREEDEDQEILGTVLYMAPELFLEGIESPQTDIYAIGVILYELLTGQSPFAHVTPKGTEQDIMELVHHHVETAPGKIVPRDGIEDLPPGFDGLILRCLQKDPAMRFADAREMLQTLDLISLPRSARQSGQLGSMKLDEVQAEEESADIRLVPGEHDGVEVVSTTISGEMKLVATADIAGDVRVWSYETKREVLFLSAPDGREATVTATTRLAFAPGGRLMAVGDRLGRLWFVDVELRTQERIPLTRGAPSALGFDKSANLMVVATSVGTLELWDVPNRKQLASLTFDLPEEVGAQGLVRALALSPHRHFLVAGTDTGRLHVWNFKDRALSGPLEGEGRASGVVYLASSPDDRYVAALRKDHFVEIWEPARRTLHRRVALADEGRVRKLIFSPDGLQILVVFESGQISVLDVEDGALVDNIRIPRGRAMNISFTDDESPVVSLARGSSVQVWDLLSMSRLTVLGSFPTRLLDVTISEGGETALTLAAGGYIDRWDLCSGRHLGRQRLSTRTPREMHKAPERGRVLVCGPRDGLQAFSGFEVNSVAPLSPLELPVPKPRSGESLVTYSVSPDSRLVAMGYSSGDVRIFGYKEACEPQILTGDGQTITTLCFSPDQQYLAVAYANGVVRLWDPAVGRVEWEDNSSRLPVHMVAFTPSGRLLSVPRGENIEIWNVENRRRVARLQGHDALIRTLVHGMDGRLLLSASDDGTARLWDVAQQRSLRVLHDHPGPVSAATFDSNLRLLLTTSGPYLSIWRVADAELLARFAYCGPIGQSDLHRWVAFTPEGYYSASTQDIPNIEMTHSGTRRRLNQEAREARYDPRAVAKNLLKA